MKGLETEINLFEAQRLVLKKLRVLVGNEQVDIIPTQISNINRVLLIPL